MAGSRSGRILIAAFVVGVVALGCSPAASPSLSAAAPSAVASAAGIVLDRTGPIGCDAIGVDYKSATIKIDAASDPDVWAETDTGKKLAVKWTAGFQPVDAGAPAILGPKGEEVARDGTMIDVPARPSCRATWCASGLTRYTSWRPTR